ncbi:hypothetical protein DM02DRAFT_613740 [Periconia macrospinosa]|uniref:Uncharacterized protein n=1 Tax=Periconia macrospinosa TaxID=97972 RepID=A0A2V1DTT4_9PLEO|nr:hypothetical protein DM02DRAFT_613740 [Periconia macrospinosa]
MYRRGDPRWNRTIQNITDTVEHANESAQEGLYSFTHSYVNPCLQSFTQCVSDCTAPCFPSQDDRRRHRARSRGRAELSFDFYDDWEEDETDGLLGWGNDNLDRLWGNSGGASNLHNNYGAASQPGRQSAMNYGNRNRDTRYNASRRKSAAQPRDGGPDPTIIPSSSYFGFLGRLPFKVGGKVLRYKPSAADLTEHPGLSRRSLEESREESQPLIEDSGEEAEEEGSERKGHGRKRSQTSASGHTTDSLSSRGDIFPSEDELDDAVPLDDEFAVHLERRTTREWHDDTSNGKSKARSGSKSSKRPAPSRMSTRSQESSRKSFENNRQREHSEAIEEIPTLSDLKQEEERLRAEEEAEVERRRLEAQQLAMRRGLLPDQHLQIPGGTSSPTLQSPRSRSSRSPSPRSVELPIASPTPLHIANASGGVGISRSISPGVIDAQTMPDSSSFHVDDSDYSSLAPTPNRPLSLRNEPREVEIDDSNFVPARLPHFGHGPV